MVEHLGFESAESAKILRDEYFQPAKLHLVYIRRLSRVQGRDQLNLSRSVVDLEVIHFNYTSAGPCRTPRRYHSTMKGLTIATEETGIIFSLPLLGWRPWLVATPSLLEYGAIASRLEAIASRLEAIA